MSSYFRSDSAHYRLLGDNDNDDPELNSSEKYASSGRSFFAKFEPSSLFIVMAVSMVLNAVLIGFYLLSTRSWTLEHRPTSMEACQVVYSPAQSVLKYKPVTWDQPYGDHLPIYDREPSEEVDAAWRNLTRLAHLKISREEAELMPNKTFPIADEPGYYLIALEVFHQLDCLDVIRRTVYPEYYPPEFPDDPQRHKTHMAHCISALRQTTLCSADISPLVWQWSEEEGKNQNKINVPHSCRDFNAIYQWAEEHSVDHPVDLQHYVEDDLSVTPIV